MQNLTLHACPQVMYGQYQHAGSEVTGDIFYFDYGCVVFWGLDQKQVCYLTSSIGLSGRRCAFGRPSEAAVQARALLRILQI